ncbi:MAG: multidrug effflux MFS transporter [Nitrosomonadales bacterium]|jgi:DHA1 family bicyclomycin/chloramphenicol resistance-like MFS transporter
MFLNNRIIILAALTALAPFAIDTYLPAFHQIEIDLNSTSEFVQQTLTFYLIPYTLMTLFHGAISDSIGRLKTIFIGLTLFSIASIGCAFAQSIEMLWFFRMLQGLGGGAGNVVARAMVRDLYSGANAQKAMATVQMIFGIAPAIAPVIGGLLLGFGWQSIFLFLMLYAILITYFAVKKLPETINFHNKIPFNLNNILTRFKDLTLNQEFIFLVLAVSFNFSAFFLYVLASPVFLVDLLGFSSSEFGFLFIPTVTGMILGSFLSRRAAGKISSSSLLKFSYIWMLIIVSFNFILSNFFEPTPFLNIGLIALYNIGMATAMPVLSLKALDCFQAMRGTAASGQAFSQMLTSSIVGGIVVPLLWTSLGELATGMMIIFFIGFYFVLKTRAWHYQNIDS